MKKHTKKILFITGTRADYGKLKPLMKAVESSAEFELYIFVAGMHLLKMFGSTYEEIRKDKYKNIHIAFGLACSSSMSMNLGSTISYLAGYVDDLSPDMVVVHGDRIEALAGTIVGALNNILVSHIEGGEVSGTIDESIRHSISKFAHLHFVSNESAKKRIVQMGEDVVDVFVIGSPDIDIMLGSSLPSIGEVQKRYSIPFDTYTIFIYHPVTTEHEDVGENIKVVVNALIESNKKYVIIFPNNDLGSEVILNEYKRLKDNKNFLIFPSMRFEYFLTLLKHAECIVGNSSSGIREAGVYGIPAVDIGSRQNGRYSMHSFKHVQHVVEKSGDILSAIQHVRRYRAKKMHFGHGGSTGKFMNILKKSAVWKKNLQKKFVDLNRVG